MKLLTQSDAIAIVRKCIDSAISDDHIGHVNDMLIDATHRFNVENGMSYLCIDNSDIPNGDDVPLRILASKLSANGWKATYKYEQRDGEWIHIDLPRVLK